MSAALSDRYTIERELGAGGMATVYLAHDVKHDRKVALKVLKPELAAVVGADRFLAEIRTTANLQHPHILPLFDSGEADGFLYFVMPYVEGESLRDRLDRDKQLPVDEAIRIASEVADALEHAHAKGVIHRDIKPANILLRDGRVQVADFGIALAVQQAGGARLTETGLSVGTPHYMSPEQASGDRQLDGRSDVYSLGCVLYEMLAGEPPHTGPTAQSILSKILTEAPRRVTEFRHTVPAHVDAAIGRALEKLPADRFASAAAFAVALGDRTFRVPGAAPPTRPERHVARTLLPWGLAALLLALLLWQRAGSPATSAPGVRHLNVALPDSIPLVFVGEATFGIGQTAMALSPDARSLVYVGAADSTTRLYVHPLDGTPVRSLRGTEGAYAPFFSPDGAQVGFFAGQRLFRTTLDGQPQPVAQANVPYGGTWSTDGRIAVITNDGRQLVIVSATGGRIASHGTQAAQGFFAAAHPHWIPGTEWILLTCYEPRHVCAMSAETGELLSLRNDGEPPTAGVAEGAIVAGSNPRYVPPGWLVWVARSRNSVLAVPFDGERLTLRGEPQPVIEGVRREGAMAAMQLAVSDRGDIVYARGANAEVGRLVWADGSGRLDTLRFVPPRVYGLFYLSPDHQRLAIKVYPEVGEGQLWFIDLERGQETQWVDEGLTENQEVMGGPWLGASGRIIANTYGSRSRLLEIDARHASGGKLLWEGDGSLYLEAVAPDGRVLFAIQREDAPGSYLALVAREDVRQLPDRPGRTVQPLLDRVGGQGLANISPDGQWLAYTSDESGAYEVYAVRLPVSEPPIRISMNGGELPSWTPQGDALFYRNGRRWYRVSMTDSGSEPFADPQLFLTGDFLNVAGPEHAVSADGRRLLLLQSTGRPSTNTLDFVIGWNTGLASRPGGAR